MSRPRGRQPAPGETIDTAPTEARVAIVIDDLGWDRRNVDAYESIEASLTMALMPGRPHSDWFYRRWRDRFEFILHMPMEPRGYPEDDPGRLALLLSMSPDRITGRVRSVLKRYPGMTGLNNHMGSAFTRWRPGMNALMEVLARRGLYYLDSLTAADSLADELGRRWEVPVVKNQVFLDHQRGRRFVRRQLDRLVRLARRDGTAIGIGHIQSAVTARVLRRRLPRYRARGVRFVPLRRVVAARGR